MKIIFAGVLISVIGVLLPWLSGRVSGSLNMGSQTMTGYELNQGLIGAGIAVIGAIFGYLGSKKIISRKTIGYILIIISVAIFVVAFSAINDLASQTVGAGPHTATIRYSPEPGVFVTLIGSLIILAGAIKIIVSKSTN